MPAAERGHKALGRAAAARHGSQLLAVLGLCTVAMLEACRGGVSQARATLVTAGLAYAVQVRLLDCTCWWVQGSYTATVSQKSKPMNAKTQAVSKRTAKRSVSC